MKQEPAQKLMRRNCHLPLLVVVGVILPAERDLTVGERKQAVIGDGDSVRVTCQVMQHVLWPAKRPLGVHHPVLNEQRSEELPEMLRIVEPFKASIQIDFLAAECGLELGHELPAKDPAQDPDRQEEPGLGVDPGGMVLAQAASRAFVESIRERCRCYRHCKAEHKQR